LINLEEIIQRVLAIVLVVFSSLVTFGGFGGFLGASFDILASIFIVNTNLRITRTLLHNLAGPTLSGLLDGKEWRD